MISGVNDNDIDTEILYTFNLVEPHVYMINILPRNVLTQNITEEIIQDIELHI